MKHLSLGLLVAVCVTFPHLAAQGAVPIESGCRWLLSQPLLWAAVAGFLAHPRLARMLSRRFR